MRMMGVVRPLWSAALRASGRLRAMVLTEINDRDGGGINITSRIFSLVDHKELERCSLLIADMRNRAELIALELEAKNGVVFIDINIKHSLLEASTAVDLASLAVKLAISDVQEPGRMEQEGELPRESHGGLARGHLTLAAVGLVGVNLVQSDGVLFLIPNIRTQEEDVGSRSGKGDFLDHFHHTATGIDGSGAFPDLLAFNIGGGVGDLQGVVAWKTTRLEEDTMTGMIWVLWMIRMFWVEWMLRVLRMLWMRLETLICHNTGNKG